MSVAALAAALFLAQAAPAAADSSHGPAGNYVDVAYGELASGDARGALAKLNARTSGRSQDPARLINLGSAYAAVGQTEKALAAYRAAEASRDRYDLQLADGTWMDSRQAARVAIRELLKVNSQASR